MLIGGWTFGAQRQVHGYDAVRDTISALAAVGAQDRWIMTVALALLGVCHLVTAIGLHAARTTGRILLGLGGLATVAVSLAPQPAHGSSSVHVSAAAVGFLALTLWPVMAWGSSARSPSRRNGLLASALLLALLVWLAAELGGGAQLGLAERVLAGAQALYPLLVVISLGRWCMSTARAGQ
ncbi:MAG: DUF998 domain-containing protein [Jatrophihabitantaceae bacterium]